MTTLIVGLVLFFAIHLVPTLPGLRTQVITKLGPLVYKLMFSVVSLLGFVLIVLGKAQAPMVTLWQPPLWGRHVTQVLMMFALIALVAAYVPCNLKRILRHPMLVAIKVWAIGHLFANGDVASVLLFGSFLAYAIYDRISVKHRALAPSDARRSFAMDAAVVLIGVVVYAAILTQHARLFGVPAM